MQDPQLTPAEFGVLKTLWRVGEATVAEVRAELARQGTEVAYTTVMTLLGRLAAKGAVGVDRKREPFVYRPSLAREQVLRSRLRAFVRDVFDGDADAVVLGLVRDQAVSLEDLGDLERLERTLTDGDVESAPAAPARGPARRGRKGSP